MRGGEGSFLFCSFRENTSFFQMRVSPRARRVGFVSLVACALLLGVGIGGGGVVASEARAQSPRQLSWQPRQPGWVPSVSLPRAGASERSVGLRVEPLRAPAAAAAKRKASRPKERREPFFAGAPTVFPAPGRKGRAIVRFLVLERRHGATGSPAAGVDSVSIEARRVDSGAPREEKREWRRVAAVSVPKAGPHQAQTRKDLPSGRYRFRVVANAPPPDTGEGGAGGPPARSEPSVAVALGSEATEKEGEPPAPRLGGAHPKVIRAGETAFLNVIAPGEAEQNPAALRAGLYTEGGRRLRTLPVRSLPASRRRGVIEVKARGLPSGLYFVRLRQEGTSAKAETAAATEVAAAPALARAAAAPAVQGIRVLR